MDQDSKLVHVVFYTGAKSMICDLKDGERLMTISWVIDNGAQGGLWFFAVSKIVPSGQEEAAYRRACNEYYAAVPEGQEERIRGWNPNWGDTIADIPEEFMEARGFRFLPLPIATVGLQVDHDQALFDYKN